MKTWRRNTAKKQEGASFNANHSWFHQFKARASFHNAKVTSKTGRADQAADWEFPEMLQEITDEGTLFTQAGFLCRWDRSLVFSSLYWKRMPDPSYISKVERLMPGYTIAKDRLILLFGGSASGDMKLKLLLVYHSENSRTLKNLAKDSLPIVWKSNLKT